MRTYLFTLSLGLLITGSQRARADFVSQVLGDSPKGFWVLDEAIGPAVDLTVSAFNGTYETGVTRQGIAGPAWVPGSGLVADFNGGTVSFPDPMNLGGSGFTIEAWIKPTFATLGQTTRIVASGDGFDGYGFGTTDEGGLFFTAFTVADYATAPSVLQPNQWQYVGVVLTVSSTARFYVNGALVATVAGPGPADLPARNLTFGNQSPGLGHTDEIFKGGIAGVSVYDAALTGTQIQAQFNASVVPEPSSYAAVSGLAALGAAFVLRHRRRKAGFRGA